MKKPIWTNEEEINLIRDISSGIKFNELAIKYNRSQSALELRLKKIIYDNMTFNKKNEYVLSKIINIPRDKILQYYFEYKTFLEKKQSKVYLKQNYRNIDNNSENVIHQQINNINDKYDKFDNTKRKYNHNNDRNINIFENKLNKIKKENEIMKLVLENIYLKKKINNFIDRGILDKKVKDNIKKII